MCVNNVGIKSLSLPYFDKIIFWSKLWVFFYGILTGICHETIITLCIWSDWFRGKRRILLSLLENAKYPNKIRERKKRRQEEKLKRTIKDID